MGDGEYENSDFGDRPADPHAESREVSDAGHPLTMAGFWDGKGRLYLNRARTQYLEFRPDDVRRFGDIDPSRSPFFGEPATWVELDPDAQVEFIRTGPAVSDDDFGVEVRVSGTAGRLGALTLADHPSCPHDFPPSPGGGGSKYTC
jgi:hypothetical protein